MTGFAEGSTGPAAGAASAGRWGQHRNHRADASPPYVP